MKLTQPTVDKYVKDAPNAPERWVADSSLPGFGLRTWPSGKASFAIKKRVGAKVLTRTIGPASILKLEEAKKRAITAFKSFLDGVDPKKPVLEPVGSPTFDAVIQDYLRDHTLKERSQKTLQETLGRFFKDWYARPIESINREEVEKKIRGITVTRTDMRLAPGNARGQGTVNKACRYVRAIFRYALDRELIELDPSAVIRSRKLVKPLNRKQSYLTASQRSKLVQGLPTSGVDPIVADYALFLIATGLRKKEALGLEWPDVDTTEK